MKSKSVSHRINVWIALIFSGLFLLSGPGEAWAQSPEDTARSVGSLIREAERNMFSGKAEEAAAKLEQARAELDSLAQADPGNKQLGGLESKYDRIRKQVDKKLGAAGVKAVAAPAVSRAAPAASDKLPAGVAKRIRDINAQLDKVDRYLAGGTPSSAKQADYILKETMGLFKEIEKSYGGQFETDHPDYTAVTARYEILKNQAGADISAAARKAAQSAQAEAEQEKESALWISRFQSYLAYPGMEGHDPEMLVFIPGTAEPEKFSEATKRYEALKAFQKTYEKAAFPHGKTDQLTRIGDVEAPQRLADFEDQFKDRVQSLAGNAENQIRQAMARLEADSAWKNDSDAQPPIVDSKWMAAIDEQVEKVRAAMGPEAEESKGINALYLSLRAKDKVHRQIRAERTFLRPDVYKGADRKELERIAGEIVRKAYPGSKVLAVSLYKPGWEEKTEEGWTDTTKTRWEKKTYQQLNAQVGSKDGSGVQCHTLHLARDKTSSGWGDLYGHVMFSDPMAEKNIGK